jgi:dipeptidyl aminopeptidase/acylaminoacyl peptidase
MPENKRPITSKDLYDIAVVTSSQISPDGENIVYALQIVDQDNEKKYMHLWNIPTSGGEPRQWTFGNHTDSNPKWSPDGQWIAFLSNRLDEKQPQIFILPVKGGEAQSITDLKGDITDMNWSPNSKKLVFQFREKDPEDIEAQTDLKKKELGRVARRIKNRVFFKLDGYGYLPQARFNLWTVDIKSKETKQLTYSSIHDDVSPIWSPDGRFIAFFSNRTDNPDLNPGKTDLFLYDLEKEDINIIKTPEGPKGHANFSPDGKKIAYLGHAGLRTRYKNTGLWIINLDQNNETHSLTSDFDFNVGGGVINDVGAFITSNPIWSKDGETLYFQVGRHGRATLHAIDVNGKNHQTLLEFDGVVSDFSIDNSNTRIGYIHGTMTDPCQIGLISLPDLNQEILTKLNKDLFDQLDLGSFEEVWFKGADDNDLQGWILKPPDFNPENEYPSILEIHGGPMAQYGYFFMHEFFYLAANGYVVYFCNPRGGQGYGEEHTKAIYYGKWGTVDYADLMCWVDLMEKQPYIDKNNMGVTGGSYGGYMTVWIIGHTDRFKAAVSQRCVSNLISMWGSSDFNWSFQAIFDDKAPYENLDVLWQCSPIKHIGSATTPTLVIHSMQDLRCAIEQSEQVYVALKNLGVDTEFLIFPDSPHGVSRTGRTDRKLLRLEGILDWFQRYLED